MAEQRPEIPPAKWQVTSYCFWCDLAKSLVTILVYGDWRIRCIHYERHSTLKDEKTKKRILNECPGPNCKNVIGYRDKLVQEELATSQS